MPNSFETDGRGPTDKQLFLCGLAMLLVVALITVLMLLKSAGRLDSYVRVVADLVNVGDGLPQKSDVKYHGLLVGDVDNVIPAANGKPNYVHINLKPNYAKSIPGTVTARVVPSNVFAVSSVQLVDRGQSAPIRNGEHIAEDTQLPTVLFQTTVSKLRDVLAATGRGRDDQTVGILAAVGAATDNRRVKLLTGGAQLNRLIAELNSIVATDAGPSTVSALLNATEGLKQTAPELLDALHQAVEPMKTLAEKRAQLTTLVSGGVHTFGTAKEAFANHDDQLIKISGQLTPVLGTFAQNSDKFVPIFTKLQALAQKWSDQAWMHDLDQINVRGNLSLTPGSTYTRADCPKYGEMKGPSCYTAPELIVRPDMPEVLLPQNYQPPPGLEPPRGTYIGPDGNLVTNGLPLVNPYPSLVDPNPPLPPWQPQPSPRIPGTSDPENLEPLPPPRDPPIPAAPRNPAPYDAPPFAPASYGGNVGPVGSQQERDQLGAITGRPASTATQLLLGPVARGTAVSFVKKSDGGPR